MQPWRVRSEKQVFSAPPWITVTEQEVELPGGWRLTPFYLVTLPEFVVVVAQTESGQIVAERQYKHGVGRVGLMLPAGIVEAGEEPLACAQRELREETGYVADQWRRLGTFVMDANRGGGRAHLFVAVRARAEADRVADPLEPLAVETLPPPAMLQAIERGEVAGMAHVAAFSLAWSIGAIR